MLDRIRDFFIWIWLWFQEPVKVSNIDMLMIYLLVLGHFFIFYIITLLTQFYFN